LIPLALLRALVPLTLSRRLLLMAIRLWLRLLALALPAFVAAALAAYLVLTLW
jgi:hypothetical protein